MGISATAVPNAQTPFVDTARRISREWLQWLTSGGLNVNLNAGTGITGTLPVANGGTGAATLTNHAVLLGSGTSAIGTVPVGLTGQVLLGHTGANPSFGAVDLTADVTGILPLANGGSGLSSGWVPVLVATASLTNSQILALPTAGIQIIAAPGAGFRIRPMAFSMSLNNSAGAYTGIDVVNSDLHLSIGTDFVSYGPVNDNTSTPHITNLSDFLGTAGHWLWDSAIPPQQNTDHVGTGFGYVQSLGVGTRSQQENQPLFIFADNTLNFTGGNAANTLKCTVYWTAESL